ncbi:GntR family transcriptional regulator [Streptomyces sp. ST2-7A]|uniref:GntR family transcriptional regulator n=1 Tax=Streptomyces sp. ST2-7A TaxID=2907214 RepID=UPI001F2C75E0|nr:GntR family transcriptional regulator [Streptomyces sp. ST2-7A]MCE7081582.1 GntR family transcriptional regulator [Streptomyces sp. ST2-7A]
MALLKYEEIAASLNSRIEKGEFPPGELLPSGRDLAEQWQVSRATVIKAMDVLRNDGVVEAKQGAGFMVVETPVGRPAGNRRPGAPRTTGGMPFTRVGAPERVLPPPHVAAALDLGEAMEALRRVRLMKQSDGTPHSYIEAWFPAEIADAAPRLEQHAPITEGTTRYVQRRTGRHPVEGTDVTTVRMATEIESHHLLLTEPTPVAVVLHTARDQEGRPLVCEEGVTPGPLWEQVETYPM